MAASEGFIEHLRDALAGLGPVSIRRMFGGAGVFADGLMFALVTGETLYLKADDVTKADFEREGLAPFTYESRGRTVTLSYWRAPERLLDEPDAMTEWASRALAAAKRSEKLKKARGRKSK
jgi:DNA transformation protein